MPGYADAIEPLPDVPPQDLRASLREQNVQLDWPMPPDLVTHLNASDQAVRSDRPRGEQP